MDSYLSKAPIVSPDRKRELSSFLEGNGLKCSDLRLLNLAFTHTSYANELKPGTPSNERLEFLGDSILGAVTAEYLFSSFDNYQEGHLSKIKAVVVSEESLSEVALSIHLEDYILVGKGEKQQPMNLKKAIMADAMEAVIAAIYLNQGMDEARKFILSFIPAQAKKVIANKYAYKDYKTELQEYLQKRRGKIPKYNLVSATGPDHELVFSVTVEFGTKVFGPAEGRNKKSAEQAAAHMALIALGIEKE